MKLRRDTFIVFEDDPGFDSFVLIFVDIVVIRNPTIDQQMIDLDYTVSSTATRGVDYQIQTCTMDPGLGSGSGLSASGSGSGLSGSGLSGSGSSGSGSGSGLSGSGSGSGGSGSGYQIQSSVFCLNVTIFGDDIVEGVEYISVNFVPLDDQVIFIGPSEAQVHIVDNDGVQLIVPDQLTATEGERQQLCVTIQEDGAARERSVGITAELFPPDTSDAAILTTNAEIPVGSSSVCVYVVAYDDSIAEFNESVLILARPNSPLDFVNQLTTLLIIDNDGVDLVVRPSDLNLMEGDVMEVCVEFAEGQIPAERVVILTVSENFDQVDLSVTNSLLFISPGDSRTCFEIEAIDDAIMEDTEVVNVTVIPINPNDRVMDGVVSVTIANNDGVDLVVRPGDLSITEGGLMEVCVEFAEGQIPAERVVMISVSETSNQTDLKIGNNLLFISPGDSRACFEIEAIDDTVIEDTEIVNIIVLPFNLDDRVMDGVVPVTIVDNDGATLSLTNSSRISLIEGATLSLCIALEKNQISLLRRTVVIAISSSQSSIKDQATTSLSHSAYLTFTQGQDNAVECTPLSIDIDMVYSVDRTFILQFMPLNTLDSFSGPNNLTVTIIENGLQFLNIIDLDGTMQLSQLDDAFSDPIYFRDGIPVGTSVETTAYVGSNGFLSFRQGYLFYQPRLFPSDIDAVRDALIVAPYWSDIDIRRQGRIYYRLIEPGRSTEDLDMILLSFVSGFIAARQSDIAADFSATTMLVAQWRDVPPFPNGGGVEGLSQSEAEFISQTNSFQCIVITDGQQTFVVFTYNSNMLEWSGPFNHAVIGVNVGTGIQGNFPAFQNHPLSGFPNVPMIASLNLGRGIEWTDIIYKIGDVSQNELDRNRSACVAMYNEDIAQFGRVVLPAFPPCPCSLFQAFFDRRFIFNLNRFFSEVPTTKYCYFELFGDFSIQECCYSISIDSFGALLDPLNSLNGEGGSLLRFNPFFQQGDYLATDVAFRTTCCEDSDLCDLYYERRPSDDCTFYRPPRRSWFWGDPHFTTLDDRGYTFNGLGEYTLIRIENETAREFELQGRTALVNGSSATQFSAFAFGLPSQAVVEIRVTEMGYLEVLLDDRNITDEITDSPSQFSTLVNIQRPSNVAIDSTVSLNENSESNMNRIESTFSGGISVTVTLLSGLLNVVATIPQEFMGQTQGLLGNFNGNATDDFIYPNGTVLNNDASDRMIHDFGLTWQITDDTSLFTYPKGFSVANFSDPDHMPAFLDEVLDAASNETRALCGDNPECIFDATETGNMEIGLETLQTNQENNNNQMIASNLPPRLEGADTFMITTGQSSVYTFTVMDDSDDVMPMIEMGLPPNAELVNNSNTYTLTWLLMSSDLIDFNRTIRITARDSLNASSLLVPQIQICACDSEGGNCTLDGLIDIIANPLTLNCECGPAYTGRFCDEDLDGCTELICFDGVECTDVAAPGEGATCGPCPTGHSGNGLNCMDIDECAVNSHNCEQMCVNTPGGFTCACFTGFTLINETACGDVNECETLNGGCQQICNNTIGSFNCFCTEGYELQMDNTTCQVIPGNNCSSENRCEQNCVLLEGAEECSCNIGFSLAENNASCLDVNECNATLAICDQLCNNTNGSFVCDCNEGYTLDRDERSCIDLDECLMAALAGEQLCMTPMMCENIIGSFDCVCPTGSEPFNNGTMCREVCGQNFYRLTETQCSRCPDNSVRPLNEPERICACENGYSRRQEDQIDQPSVLCGENFYRLTETQCSRCPENSVRPLNELERICACENGYSRRQEDQIDQPCVPHVGFVNASLTFQETNVPNSESIPLYLSANSSREITVTFTVTPSMYMSFIGSQVVFPPGTRMQSLTVDIPGNMDPVDGIIQFSISIDEGSEFVVGGSAGPPLLASVEVTILEDDNLTPVLESNSILITLPDLTAEAFTSEVQQRFRMTAADAINTYCSRESCLTTESRRKRQTGVMVTANDIRLRDIRNNDQNQLQFSMFVQTNNGQNLLQVDTLQRAIQQSNSTFATNGFIGLSISPLIVPTTQPPAPTASSLSDGAIAGIVIGTIVGAILLVLLLILIIALIRHCSRRQKFVFNTYGYQAEQKSKGSSIRYNEPDQNLYIQTPAVEMKDIDTEPIVRFHTSSHVEKEEEEEETEMFANKAATESENGVSLSEDIARELGEGQEMQVMKMSFDEPGEETKL